MAAKPNAKKDTSGADITDFDNFLDSVTKQSNTIREPAKEVEWVSSGMVAANLALSGHPACGWPMGKMINFEGLSDSGKSLMMQTGMREAQKKYGSNFRGLYIDSERGTVMQRLEQMGLFVRRKPKNIQKPDVANWEDNTGDPRASTFRVLQTTDLTDLADNVLPSFFKQVQAHPEMNFILAFDSISMLMTQHERDSDFNTQDMARAKELRKFMRLINDAVRPNLSVFMVHHQTHRISTTGMLSMKQGSHERDIGGGTAMKFVPDVRVEIDYVGKEKRGSGDDETVIGQKCRIRVVKTRLYKPMIEAVLTIDHSCGFTQLGGLFDQLEQLKLVEPKGDKRWTCKALFGDKSFFQKNLQDELEKPEHVQKVVDLIVEHMRVETFGGEGAPETDVVADG